MSAELAKNPGDFRRANTKAWVLAVLVAVLLVLWARLILGGPRFGIAAMLPQAATSDAKVSASASDDSTAAGLALAQWAQEPVRTAPRNFFKVPYTDYQVDPNHPLMNSLKPDDHGKSESGQADQIRERQKLVEDLREQAANLTLESTMPGPHPQAWVNGLLVGVGDPIGQTGFTVFKIENRRIFIERLNVQIELSMK